MSGTQTFAVGRICVGFKIACMYVLQCVERFPCLDCLLQVEPGSKAEVTFIAFYCLLIGWNLNLNKKLALAGSQSY